MSNTYTQLYIQFVFAVKNRTSLIHPSWEVQLFKYITGIVQNHKHKMIAINGMPDHVHLFLGLHPDQSLSTLMQTVKGDSSKWINTQGFIPEKFQWQEGFGAFSYHKNQIGRVYQYITNQKEYHSKHTFLEEYKTILQDFDVPFDPRYLFKSIDWNTQF
jgi:REP element-mobilizing transposase RayT